MEIIFEKLYVVFFKITIRAVAQWSRNSIRRVCSKYYIYNLSVSCEILNNNGIDKKYSNWHVGINFFFLPSYHVLVFGVTRYSSLYKIVRVNISVVTSVGGLFFSLFAVCCE